MSLPRTAADVPFTAPTAPPPEHILQVSKPFGELAEHLVATLPRALVAR